MDYGSVYCRGQIIACLIFVVSRAWTRASLFVGNDFTHSPNAYIIIFKKQSSISES